MHTNETLFDYMTRSKKFFKNDKWLRDLAGVQVQTTADNANNFLLGLLRPIRVEVTRLFNQSNLFAQSQAGQVRSPTVEMYYNIAGTLVEHQEASSTKRRRQPSPTREMDSRPMIRVNQVQQERRSAQIPSGGNRAPAQRQPYVPAQRSAHRPNASNSSGRRDNRATDTRRPSTGNRHDQRRLTGPSGNANGHNQQRNVRPDPRSGGRGNPTPSNRRHSGSNNRSSSGNANRRSLN
jgi:hypothetical protein